MQLNVFCSEKQPGRLFLGMEVNGPVGVVREVALRVAVETERTFWADAPTFIRRTVKFPRSLRKFPRNS